MTTKSIEPTPTPRELRPGVHLVTESLLSGSVSLWRWTGEPVPLGEVERLITHARSLGADDDSLCQWGHEDGTHWHLSIRCPRGWSNGMPMEYERRVAVPVFAKTTAALAFICGVVLMAILMVVL